MVVDEPSLPLVESNFAHFVALERRVSGLAKDYKNRRVPPFTPHQQIQYMRNIPDFPQINNILDKELTNTMNIPNTPNILSTLSTPSIPGILSSSIIQMGSNKQIFKDVDIETCLDILDDNITLSDPEDNLSSEKENFVNDFISGNRNARSNCK
ncbi:6013_t:CDS:2 [Funneliformis geosporum]|uniref:6013_t:CDS:1 n=1 Tax=Funneliformis geosporum TaxID=1117311 RepID=A0A9W4STV7_9GLOM|nr:6013_t:CDS:2 [Funneliformis geosporum]